MTFTSSLGGRVREVPFSAIFRGQLPDHLTTLGFVGPGTESADAVKVPLVEDRCVTSMSLATPVDTHDALCANALSEGVRFNGRDPDFSRGLLPLSPQSFVVLLNQGLARRFDCFAAYASRRVLSADLASLANARSVRRASISPPETRSSNSTSFVPARHSAEVARR